MGWLVWLALSALGLAASYVVAAAVWPEKGALDRFITAMVVDSGLILLAIHLCGFASRLEPVTLGVVSTMIFGGAIAASLRFTTPAAVRAAFVRDLGSPARMLHDAWRDREPAIGTLVPAALAVGTTALMIWWYRSWTWDPVWYHVPKTSLAIQTQSLRWLDIPNIWTQGNPANLELLAVWNCIFQRDNRLDDSSQWPFLFVGAAVIAAWCRRVGASRPVSAAAGAVWIAMPPVYLQAHSTHADVAWNALFTAAIYFTVAGPERRGRWMGFLCWGLFLGMKYTGLFHIALWSPYLLALGAVEVYRQPAGQRLRRALDVVASGLFAGLLGCFKYLQNLINAHNPMWPFNLRVRSLGLHFYGPSDPGQEYGAGAGGSPTFFGAPHAFEDLISSWYNANPFYCPDVRSGGFGPVFRWLLLFCVVALAFDVLRGRNWRRALLPLALFIEALQVPVPYMTRFVLAAGSASLVLFAIVHTDTRWRLGRLALSVALVALTAHGYDEGYRGYIVHPRYYDRARSVDAATRSALQIDTFLWPTEWGVARERETRGGVLAYDEGVHFLNDLFNHDFSSRVLYVSTRQPVAQYLARIHALRPRWVGVTRGTAAERALIDEGAEFLFQTPDSPMAMYRMPRRP
ncbi:MAG: hypothetical protein R3A52_32280 [Polyangiales bacterium]